MKAIKNHVIFSRPRPADISILTVYNESKEYVEKGTRPSRAVIAYLRAVPKKIIESVRNAPTLCESLFSCDIPIYSAIQPTKTERRRLSALCRLTLPDEYADLQKIYDREPKMTVIITA